MDVASFREAFPNFAESADARVKFFIALAERLLPSARWGDLREDGIALYVAHNLTLEAEISKDKSGAGAINVAAGPVTGESKTVGSMSKSVTRAGASAQGTSLLNAGAYNSTVYGQQFWQLVLIVGAGGFVA